MLVPDPSCLRADAGHAKFSVMCGRELQFAALSRVAKPLSAEPRVTLKCVVKDILREAEMEGPASPDDDDLVTVRFSWDLDVRLKTLA